MTNSTQIAVIGGGPGGYAAAFLAADLGMQVTLIDEALDPGGVCLYRGCMPSKALLHVAKVLTEAREARAWGVDFGEPAIDIDRLRAWKDEVVGKLTGGLGQLSTQRGVTYLRGRAELVGATAARVTAPEGDTTELRFEHKRRSDVHGQEQLIEAVIEGQRKDVQYPIALTQTEIAADTLHRKCHGFVAHHDTLGLTTTA